MYLATMKIREVFFSLALLVAGVQYSVAQTQIPVPASPQEKPVVLQHATVHTGDGKVISDGLVVCEKGKITFVGESSSPIANVFLSGLTGGADSFDLTGKHLYPGLIALNTTIGLTEVDLLRASRDFNEVGEYNPHVRAVIAYNPESRITPTLKHNGVMMVEAAPTGGVISGKSALLALDGWNWEDASIVDEVGIHLHWPRSVAGKEKDYAKKVNEIHEYFEEAQAYYNGASETVNLRFEAMKPVFAKTQKVFVHADSYEQISGAIGLGEDFNISVVVVGGRDSWKLTRSLKEHNVPVILSRVHRLPGNRDDDYDLPYKTPQILQDSGVIFAISDNGSWPQRNLPFQAGTAVGFGLSPEAALTSITLNPAKIMGVDDRLGSIAKGKTATLVVSEGDILDMRTNDIFMALIEGRVIDLTNHQEEKYKKFRAKYQN